MRTLLCGWTGSTNLGDELVFTGMRQLLGSATRIRAVSIDPAATRVEHGVAAIDHRRLDRIAVAARSADLVVLGGGGLVQDETSPFNLPYHLSRPLLARLARTPWIAIGLGVGPLSTRTGRWLANLLRTAEAVTVRDEPSRDLLASIGIASTLSADAAFHIPSTDSGHAAADDGMPAPRLEVEGSAGRDHLAVSLRPWTGASMTATQRLLPVGWRNTSAEPAWFVPTIAAALDRVVAQSGLPVRFVALQTDRDAVLHERIAAHMRSPVTLVVPNRRTVLAELATARLVVAMRYHAGIGATLAGRPSVLIGYSPKVDALAATLATGAAHLAFERELLATLDDAIVAQLDRPGAAAAVVTARSTLRGRTEVDRQLLADITR